MKEFISFLFFIFAWKNVSTLFSDKYSIIFVFDSLNLLQDFLSLFFFFFFFPHIILLAQLFLLFIIAVRRRRRRMRQAVQQEKKSVPAITFVSPHFTSSYLKFELSFDQTQHVFSKQHCLVIGCIVNCTYRFSQS